MAKGLSTFHFSVLCWLGLSLRAFVLRYVPTIPTGESFYHESLLNFFQMLAFSASIEMMWCLSFLLLMCCIKLVDLDMLNHSCTSGMNPTWSWCMILVMYCWIQFANILLKILASIFIKYIGLWFSFLQWVCLVLISGWWWIHRIIWGVFSPLQSFWVGWER